jgi:hypothetical protein
MTAPGTDLAGAATDCVPTTRREDLHERDGNPIRILDQP